MRETSAPSEASMMALHRSPESRGGSYPTDSTLQLVRTSLARHLGGHLAEVEVHHALEALAREARGRRLHAEDVLIAFKTIWNELGEVARIDDSLERKRLLDQLVTFCIDAYYRGETR